MSRSAIPSSIRRAVFARDLGCCSYCRLAQFGHGATFHINHILPRSKGGPTSIENLALQCPHCSLHKANKTSAVDPLDGSPSRLYHPLEDRWEDHFRFQSDGSCMGLTSVGRATIRALCINDPIPRMGRLFQMMLGIIQA